MSECTCGELFRTGEDYRDHLPCQGVPTQQLLRKSDARVAALTQFCQHYLAHLRANQAHGIAQGDIKQTADYFEGKLRDALKL